MKQFFKKIKNSKAFNIILSLLLFICSFVIILGFYSHYYQIIWLLAVFSFILFLIVRKPKPILRKITLFLTILLFAILTSFLGTISESPKTGVIITNNLQKAKEINSFLKNKTDNSHFDSTVTIVDHGFLIEPNTDNDDFNNLLILLAENNAIDKNVEFIYFDTLFSNNFEIIKKRYKKEAEKIIGKIDGIKTFNIDLSNWKNKNKYPVITLNVEMYNNFNQEKIEKTIKDIFVSSSLTLNISKSKEVNHNWHKKYDDIILGAYRNKKYKEALEVVEYVNQKAENTYDETCTKKAISIEEKIKNDPKNYKLYIERGKLKTPGIRRLFSMDKENHCNGAFYESDIDSESAINDYKIALELNPNAYKAYELIVSAKKFSNGGTYEKPNYNDEILEYALKAAEGGEEYEHLYYDISKIYKLKKDKENADKYYKKAEEASKKYAEKLIQRTSRIIPDNPHVKHTK